MLSRRPTLLLLVLLALTGAAPTVRAAYGEVTGRASIGFVEQYVEEVRVIVEPREPVVFSAPEPFVPTAAASARSRRMYLLHRAFLI